MNIRNKITGNVPILECTTASNSNDGSIVLGFGNKADSINPPFDGVFILIMSADLSLLNKSLDVCLDRMYGNKVKMYFEDVPVKCSDFTYGCRYVCSYSYFDNMVFVMNARKTSSNVSGVADMSYESVQISNSFTLLQGLTFRANVAGIYELVSNVHIGHTNESEITDTDVCVVIVKGIYTPKVPATILTSSETSFRKCTSIHQSCIAALSVNDIVNVYAVSNVNCYALNTTKVHSMVSCTKLWYHKI